MEKYVKPATVDGTVAAPSSKSEMQRAVAAASLAQGPCEILHPSFCDDAAAALNVVKTLGAGVTVTPDRVSITPGATPVYQEVDCGESGLSLRMFAAIAALRDDQITLTGRGGLPTRPIRMLEAPLRALGVDCQTQDGFLPVRLKGPLRPGRVEVDASVTSQFLTGLLMALPVCNGDSELIVPRLKSQPYVEMTLRLLQKFGVSIEHQNFRRFSIPGLQHYRATTYDVEGDWSGAAFLLAAGALAGRVRVSNLNPRSLQADIRILDALEHAGAQVKITGTRVEVTQQSLTGFEFDATDCPDLFPPLVALAACCQGTSRISGVHRLRHKECDRATALCREFTTLGAAITLSGDSMLITGTTLEGGIVDSYHDHRMTMACAVAALRSKRGVTIRDWECVSKSYPEFFDDLQRLGGQVS